MKDPKPKFKKLEILDLVKSETARKNKLSNLPNDAETKNLEIMCEFLNILKIISIQDFEITSCFRSKELNKLIGGKSNSFHLLGLASDLTCKDLEQMEKLIRYAFVGFKKGKNLFTKIYKERNFMHFHFSIM